MYFKCFSQKMMFEVKTEPYFFYLSFFFSALPFMSCLSRPPPPAQPFPGREKLQRPAALTSAWGKCSADCRNAGTHFPVTQQKRSEDQLNSEANVQTPAPPFLPPPRLLFPNWSGCLEPKPGAIFPILPQRQQTI